MPSDLIWYLSRRVFWCSEASSSFGRHSVRSRCPRLCSRARKAGIITRKIISDHGWLKNTKGRQSSKMWQGYYSWKRRNFGLRQWPISSTWRLLKLCFSHLTNLIDCRTILFSRYSFLRYWQWSGVANSWHAGSACLQALHSAPSLSSILFLRISVLLWNPSYSS
jgi:hypothetical protein